jgi:hypothetical protein
MHSRDDARVPFDQGRRLAAGILGARFVLLASRNHLILEDEPAFPRFLQEMRAFLACATLYKRACDGFQGGGLSTPRTDGRTLDPPSCALAIIRK